MENKENQSLHSQNAVFRIALGANILAWLILAFYVINFMGDLQSVVQNWPLQMPPDLLQQIVAWSSLLSKPLFGAFYFFILQGISQLLYVGLDIYLDLTDTGEEDEEETEA
ncbi:MAG: hypothetical protein CVU44_05810 [Chloroflexi bacterium HGW-Chloroflexi-6]|nr:MAG: hypothetical protein CVU44_05810 [Chloroflexi bacterium HGW-Chloroflexi-6]